MSIADTSTPTQPYTNNSSILHSESSLGNNAPFVASESDRAIQATLKNNQPHKSIDTESVRKIDKIRYKMLHTTRTALNRYAHKKHRIADCHYKFAPNMGAPTLQHSNKTKKTSWHGLQTCDNEFCPVCSVKIGIKTRDRIARIMGQAYKDGYKPVLVTLTAQHDHSHTQEDNVIAMLTAWRKMQQSRAYRKLLKKYGVWGYLRSVDQTFNPTNGLHFHFHIVFLIDEKIFNEDDWSNDYDDDSLWSGFADCWQHQVRAVGRDCLREIAVDFQAEKEYVAGYIANFGKEPKQAHGLSSEMSLKTLKRSADGHYTLYELMLLAHSGDGWAMSMYAQYCDAMKSKKRLQMSDNVIDMEKEIPEDTEDIEDIEDIEDTKVPSFRTTYDAFRIARNQVSTRARWMHLHETGDYHRLATEVAHAHILGKFGYQMWLLKTPKTDGWHDVIEINLQARGAEYVEEVIVGRVLCCDGRAIETKITQPLDSGFYGKLERIEDEIG